MQTRRAFLKLLVGLGAVALPWTTWPDRWEKALNTWVKRPPAQLIPLPPKPAADSPATSASTGGPSFRPKAMEDIKVMTGPEAQGRRAGSTGEAKVATYLINQLRSLGLKPLGENGRFTQAFTIPAETETMVNGRLTFRPDNQAGLRSPCVNVLGCLEGTKPEETICLSAHYDHLGVFEGRLYPGANDNASGVGCVLDVVRRLVSEGSTPKRSVAIVFWSAEEMGFLGSSYFVQHPTIPLARLVAVINADTVGNGTIGDFALWANGANIVVRALQQAAAKAKAWAVLTAGGGHNSDQISFAQEGIPAATLMAREWLVNNHTPEDTEAFVKPEQIYLAGEIIYQAVKSLAY